MRRTIRLLHTSDIHLGDGRHNARPALEGVVQLGLELEVDALLIAGDLFDHNRVDDEERAGFLQQVRRFGRPVVVLPGNHDCFNASSVYRHASFGVAPGNLLLLTDSDNTPHHLPGLDLEVWGRATVNHEPSFRPLADLPLRQNEAWYVVLAHGHVIENTRDHGRSSPILQHDIAAAPCDYIALGHCDLFRDVSQGSVPAFYSGAPRALANDDGATAALVQLSEEGVTVVQTHLRGPGVSS